MKKNKKGFTIVELVIVIAVIAILAGVLIPTFAVVIDNARKSAAYSNCRNAMTTVISDSEYGQVEEGTIFVSGEYYAVFENSKLGEATKFEWSNSNECEITVGSKEATFSKGSNDISLSESSTDYESYTSNNSEATTELENLGVKIYVVKSTVTP